GPEGERRDRGRQDRGVPGDPAGDVRPRGDVSTGDRMTALDAAFFTLERTGRPLRVGSVSIAEGRLDFGRLVDDVASRLHLIPRYTQRVVPVPFGLAHPTWEPMPKFDVRHHGGRHQLR